MEIYPPHHRLGISFIRERRLCAHVSPIEVLAQNAVENLQKTPEEAKQYLEESFAVLKEGVERSNFIESIKEKIQSVDEKVRDQITANLEWLKTRTTLDALRMNLSELAGAVQLIDVQENADALKSVPQRVGNAFEKTTEYIFPEKMTKNLSYGQKVAIGVATGSVALAVGIWLMKKLYQRGKDALAKGREEAEKSGGGYLKVLLITAGVGLLAFAGYKGYKLYQQYESIGKMIEGMKKEIGLGNREKNKEEEEKWKKAEEIYRVSPPEQRADMVRAEFGLKPGETSLEYEKFMKEMDAKYETIEHQNVLYATLEVATENIELNMKTIVGQIEEWLENHSFETGAAGVLAYKIGVLKAGLGVAGGGSLKALSIATGLAGWGVQHPLLSLLMVGGTIGAKSYLEVGYKYAAENIEEIIKSSKNNISPFLDSSKNFISLPSTIAEHMKRLAELPASLHLISTEQVTNFLLGLVDSIPEAVQLSEAEIIVQRNAAGLHEFREYLKEKKGIANASARTRPNVTNIDNALAIFEQFETLHLGWAAGEKQPEEVSAVYQELQKALHLIGIQLLIEDGSIRWNDRNTNSMKDLCIDFSLQTKQEKFDAADSLYLSESGLSFAFFNAVRQLRYQLHQASERVPDSWKESAVGQYAVMALGGVLYVVDPSNLEEYAELSGSLAEDLFGNDSWEEWLGKHGKATAVGGLMLVSGRLLKKIAIGGGPLMQWKPIHGIGYLTPGVQQLMLGHNTWESLKELDLFTRGFGYVRAREYNTVLRMAGLRPDMIHAIENGDIEAMKDIGHFLNIKRLPTDVVKMKEKVRLEFIEHLKRTEIRGDLRTVKFWRWFTKGRYGRAENLYEDLKNAYAVRPPPNLKSAVRASKEVVSSSVDYIGNLIQSPALRAALQKLKVSPSAFAQAIKNIKISPACAQTFSKSIALCESLVQSFAKNGKAGINHAVRIGEKALFILRTPVGRSISKYGAVIGMEILFYKIVAAEFDAQIAEADSEGLKDFYSSQKDVAANRAAIGAGMGVALLASNDITLIAGGASLGGPVLLSTVVGLPAIAVADYSAGKINTVTEGLLKNAKDWERSSLGALRSEISVAKPGEQTYWQQASRGTRAENWYRWLTTSKEEYKQWTEEGSATIESGKTKKRREMTQGYFAKQSMVFRLAGEDDASYQQRYQEIQKNQMQYMQDMTRGEFDLPDIHLYEQAEIHAEILSVVKRIKDANTPMTVVLQMDAEGKHTKEFDLRQYETLPVRDNDANGVNRRMVQSAFTNFKRDQIFLDIALARESCSGNTDYRRQKDFEIQCMLLNRAKHYLALVDEKIHTADIKGWEWTGGEEQSRAIVRMVISNQLRLHLRRASDALWDAGTNLTSEQYEDALVEMQRWMQSLDPAALLKTAEIQYYASSPMEHAAEYLEVPWLLQNLYVHTV